MDYHKKVKLIPFTKDRECRLSHCQYNDESILTCNNYDMELLESTYEVLVDNLKSDNKGRLVIEDGLSFDCPCYELDENYCPVCKSKLTYNQSKCNYICHICGHGMEEY